ncbi:hypothetical protein K438DRAFT_1970044 [Mycena galopus ATCC 62051]|nr:hypothetical protein K438DRAFT_1970044 [Mycena galopus ATCC 62051]
MVLCVFSARPLGVLVTLGLLFLGLSPPSAAQTVTGTLYGIAYPTNYVQLVDDAYDYEIFEYLWIGNDPQITILGTGADGQTTFGYHDVYTQQNLGGISTATPTLITEAGTLVQDSAGLYYDGSFAAETCSFGPEATVGPAVCVFGITIGGVAATVTGSITPFFTYIAALPTSTPTSGGKSGSGSPTSTSSLTPAPALPKHKVPVGAISGGVIGGLAVIGAVLAFLLWRRRRRHRYSMREKNELDLEPGLDPAIRPTPFVHNEAESDQPLTSSLRYAVSSTVPVTTTGSTTAALPPPETRRDHRRRLKQMQDTVLQLQRNISVTEPAVESEGASQQQMVLLLEEIERLRAIVAHTEVLPAYEQ